MKTKLIGLLLTIISVFAFVVVVNAATAPNTLSTGALGAQTSDYVSGGGTVYIKQTRDLSAFLYCEDALLKFPANTSITLGKEVDRGFTYIMQNKPKTGDSNRDYYIMQTAVWWYRDYLTGSSNLTASFKTYCTSNRNTNSTCGYIYNLVEGAKAYRQSIGTITYSTGTPTFTTSGDYFVSSSITVTSNNLKSFTGLKLSGAPSGATIINSTLSNGTGTFQVRVPVSSVTAGSTVNFSVIAEGSYSFYSVYDYYYATGYQRVIYDKIFETPYNVSATKNMSLTRESVQENNLSIFKRDGNGIGLAGAGLTLYSGDCRYSTCLTANRYATWTSTANAYTLRNVPVGYYTIVETSTPYGYKTADKGLIYVSSTSGSFSYTVYNYPEVTTQNSLTVYKLNQNGSNLSGAGITLYSGNCQYSTCSSSNYYAGWTTTNSPYILYNLPIGYYTVVETYTPYGYKTADKGLVYVGNNSSAYNYTMYNYPEVTTQNSLTVYKLNQNGNNLSGAGITLYSGNCQYSTCSSSNYYAGWTTTNSPYILYNLPIGYYTVVETYTPSGYKTADKGLVYVGNNNSAYNYTMYNYPEVTEKNSLTVYKQDQNGNNFSGVGLSLYSGVCHNTTCSSSNLYATWVSTNSPYVLRDLPVGYYTLVETSTPSGYKTAEKVLLYIARSDSDYSYTLINYPNDQIRISKTDITGTKEVAGATLVLKNSAGQIIDSWVSGNTPKYVTLSAGDYSLTETIAPKGYKLNTTTIYFRIDAAGKVYQRNIAGVYTLVDYIKMINEVEDVVSISKLDSKTNAFVIGAKLVVKNIKGETVSTWMTSNETRYLTLAPGEYYITEIVTPSGYKANNETIYFKLEADGTLSVKNSNGVYTVVNGIIVYNTPEDEVIIDVPKTGLSSTMTYLTGTLVLISGAWILMKNGAIRV